jgi:hypothetical protein
MRTRIALALAVVGLLLVPASSPAAFHLMKIRELHEGGGASADYVELQMHAAGQRFVSGHYLVTYAGAAPFVTYQLPGGVANGENQRTILIASQGTIAATPDFVVPVTNLFPGPAGSACFIDILDSNGIDCVSVGATAAPSTNPSPVGNPALFLSGGLLPGQSIERTIKPNCSTLLEAADDSDDSGTDFALATPSPRPNSVAPSEHDCTPDLTLTGKKKQKAGRKVVVKATCADQDCAVSASGKVKLKGGGSAAVARSKSVKLKKAGADLSAGDRTKLVLKLSRSAVRKVKRALRKGGKATAIVRAQASGSDPEFEPTKAKRKVRLKG